MYSLNNLLSNRAAEEEVGPCLSNKVPQAREHRGNLLMNRDGRKERTARDLVSARKRRGKKEEEGTERSGNNENKQAILNELFWHVRSGTLYCSVNTPSRARGAKMITSLSHHCEIKKCLGESHHSMNMKQVSLIGF